MEQVISGLSHFVHFHREGEYPSESISDFVVAGIEVQESSLITTTVARANEIRRKLETRSLRAEELDERGWLTFLNVDDTLEQVKRGGVVDRSLLESLLNEAMGKEGMPSAGKRWRFAGDMSAAVAAEVGAEEAVELERWGNTTFLKERRQRYCLYPYSAFSESARAKHFCAVCDEHDAVVANGVDEGTLKGVPAWLSTLKIQSARYRLEVAKRQKYEVELSRNEQEFIELFQSVMRERQTWRRDPSSGGREKNADAVMDAIYAVCREALEERKREESGSRNWERATGEILGYGKLVALLEKRGKRFN
jgi:hypothetical protein